MSLLHRASTTELSARRASQSSLSQRRPSTTSAHGVSPEPPILERNPSHASNGSRRLSYNPLSDIKPSATPLPAEDVPGARRVAQVAVAVVYCLLAAGVVFGYAALKPVLIAEGVYRDSCTSQELEDGTEVCQQQELRLNLMFTLAAVSTNVAALPIGTILDRCGPRITSLLGCVFLSLGALFLAFAGTLSKSHIDGYIPGYLFLALGGPCVFIPSFQLSNAFPRQSGLVLALLTGAFDSSSALFLIYRLIYRSTAGAFTPQRFFLVYLVVPVGIALAQLTLMPSTSYQTGDAPESPTPPTSGRRTSDPGETSPLLDAFTAPAEERDTPHTLHHLSASRQIMTPYFILITLFTIAQMTRINFFVATIRPQYAHLITPAFAKQLNSFFDVVLPLGGVLSVPFVGWLLDHLRTVYVLIILVGTTTAIGILGLIPQPWAAYTNVAIFVLYRPFFYTAVSDYSAKVFGFATFGKVYGLIICLAGLGNFSQSGLDKLTYDEFDGDYRPANVVLLGTVFTVGAALVAYVWWKGQQSRRESLEEEAEASVGTAREARNPT